MTTTSKRQRLRNLISEAVTTGMQPYKHDPNLCFYYTLGLLRELLSYSAQDQYEVWQQLEKIIEQDKQNR